MKIRLADYIADFLVAHNINTVFSVTGGGAMHLNDALGKKSKLNVYYNHHEQACAIAAEGYTRITNRPACVCVTTGPGGTNAISGVFGAYVDSIPMLIISGQVKYNTTVRSTNMNLRQLGDQEFDITKCVQSLTKYAVMVERADEIKYHLEKALYLAKNERPGPCWLDIPLNIQSEIIESDNLKGFNEIIESVTKINNKTVETVWELLNKAKRPLFFAGSGIRLSDGYDIFLKLLEKTNIPCVTAWNSNDLLDNNHTCYAGRPGTVGERVGNFMVQNADLLVVLGSRLNIRQISYNYENFGKNAYKIVVDIDKLELQKPTIQPDMTINCNVLDFMKKLLDISHKTQCQEWIDYKNKLIGLFSITQNDYYKQSKVNPYCFIESLTKSLKEKDVIACSNGSACVVTFQAATMKKGQRFFTNSGSASMGYGLPASIGACIANKKMSTICIEGDGSLQMNIQELQTVVQNKLPIKIVVLNNGGYHSIRQTQNNFFAKPLVGIGPESKDLSFPELELISNAYKIPYYKIENHKEMDGIIDKFLKSDGYALLEVVLNDQPFTPKLSSRKLDDGTMLSASLEDMYPFIDRNLYKELMIAEK